MKRTIEIFFHHRRHGLVHFQWNLDFISRISFVPSTFRSNLRLRDNTNDAFVTREETILRQSSKVDRDTLKNTKKIGHRGYHFLFQFFQCDDDENSRLNLDTRLKLAFKETLVTFV